MNEQILGELKDVHLPPEPSAWPLASGFYWVFFLVLIAVGAGVWFLWRRQKKRAFRRRWQREFQGIESRFHETKNVSQLQTDLSWLIRRLAYESARSKKGELKISELGPSMERVFGASASVQNLLNLLSEDRFKATNKVNGDKLLAAFKELSCRI